MFSAPTYPGRPFVPPPQTSLSTLSIPDGTVSAPALSPDSDSTTGVYFPGGGDVALSSSGVNVLTADQNVFDINASRVELPYGGTVANPKVYFESAPSTGWHHSAANRLDLGIDGVLVMSNLKGQLISYRPIRVSPNTMALPAYSYSGNSSSGLHYDTGTNTLWMVQGASGRLGVSGTSVRCTECFEIEYNGGNPQQEYARPDGTLNVDFGHMSGGNDFHMQQKSGSAGMYVEHPSGGVIGIRPYDPSITNATFRFQNGNGASYDTLVEYTETEATYNIPVEYGYNSGNSQWSVLDNSNNPCLNAFYDTTINGPVMNTDGPFHMRPDDPTTTAVAYRWQVGDGSTGFDTIMSATNRGLEMELPIHLKSYTVAGLPSGTTGDLAIVTNDVVYGETAVCYLGSQWRRLVDNGVTSA